MPSIATITVDTSCAAVSSTTVVPPGITDALVATSTGTPASPGSPPRTNRTRALASSVATDDTSSRSDGPSSVAQPNTNTMKTSFLIGRSFVQARDRQQPRRARAPVLRRAQHGVARPGSGGHAGAATAAEPRVRRELRAAPGAVLRAGSLPDRLAAIRTE